MKKEVMVIAHLDMVEKKCKNSLIITQKIKVGKMSFF